MSKKGNIYKSTISLFLILAFFSFKVLDLHTYSHTKDSVKGSHCELCLHTQHNKKSLDLSLPVTYEFQVTAPESTYSFKSFYKEFIKVKRFPFGISLNKAPPTV